MLSAGVQHLNLSDAQWGKIKAISVAPFRPMGLTENEWQLVAGLAAGVVAKEVTVGTLSALYSLSDSEPQLQEFKATRVVQSAWNEFLINIRWEENTALSHDRAPSLAKTLSASIDDKIAMMSYLIFVLLYFPCISVYAVTKQEVGVKWAIFSAIWSTSLAYLCAVIFYQILSYC
jgi:ferrous iron transport protein B